MPISHLFHVAIKTNDLELTTAFYCDVLGLEKADRPNFAHKGAWLRAGDAEPLIHLYLAGPGVADGKPTPLGTGAIDHLSIFATGYANFVERFRRYGLDWREYEVPGTDLWQLFVHDPSGVMVELTFIGPNENDAKPDMSEGRKWRADEQFFRPYSVLEEQPA